MHELKFSSTISEKHVHAELLNFLTEEYRLKIYLQQYTDHNIHKTPQIV